MGPSSRWARRCAVRLWPTPPGGPTSSLEADVHGHHETRDGDLVRRPALGPRDRDRGVDRDLPGPGDNVGIADGRAERRDVPRGAPGGSPRVVLLDGLLEHPGEG